MKKTTVMFGLVILTIGAQAAMCGGASVGLSAGLNIATINESDYDYDSRLGGYFGGFVEQPITPIFSIQPELMFTMKGAKTAESDMDITFKLNYWEIPVLLRANIPTDVGIDPFLVAGPSIAFNVTSKMESDSEEEVIPDIKGTDFGLIFGGGVGFPVGDYVMSVVARYEMGLTSFDDSEDEFDVKNNVISVGAAFTF